ncbi:MAG: iron exporter MbfA [Phycisphaerae bacterium]
MAKRFKDLTEQEILALAIGQEEEDGRIYGEFAHNLAKTYPATAKMFTEMQAEEAQHRHKLIELHRAKFGDHIPLIKRDDVKGFIKRRPLWLVMKTGVNAMRRQAEIMELENTRYYEKAAGLATDAAIRKLLVDLAEAERRHASIAEALESQHVPESIKREEEAAERRLFVLQIVQPGLAGLMDGSVSTLAPVFAAAIATQDSFKAFLVGLAASIGAGISMAFAEALSDDGALTGRGHPFIRGAVCGLMTTAGGIGHTIPFLIPNFHIALGVAMGVVALELCSISFIRHRYMDTPFLQATFQVVFGGVLVLIAGFLIGSA